jgi:hydroxyethylthiazole kinase
MAEIGVLAGTGGEIRGVDAVGEGGGALEAANAFVKKFDCVAAITGRVDIVAGNGRILKVANGDPIMSKVTGTGCMATSVIAAFAAASEDYVEAAAEGLAAFGLAGQIAVRNSNGPGTFHVQLYDAMANMAEDSLAAGAKISDG